MRVPGTQSPIETQLRLQGRSVELGRLGMGTYSMTTEGRPDRKTCIDAVRAAYDAGIRLLDTADVYHLFGEKPGYGESLLREALEALGPDAAAEMVIATKGGLYRKQGGKTGFRLSPELLRAACLASRDRLGVEAIDLYQLHHFDASRAQSSFAELIKTLKKLKEEGVIRTVGLSNVTPEELEEAKKILGDDLVSVQAQYNLEHRENEPLLRKAEALGVTFFPWAPFGGVVEGKSFEERHPLFRELGEAHQVSARAAYLSYLMGLSPVMMPIPGASRAQHVVDWQTAPQVELSQAEIERIEAAYGTSQAAQAA